jgi:hypothetical protein
MPIHELSFIKGQTDSNRSSNSTNKVIDGKVKIVSYTPQNPDIHTYSIHISDLWKDVFAKGINLLLICLCTTLKKICFRLSLFLSHNLIQYNMRRPSRSKPVAVI